MEGMKVSIVTITWNAARTLQRTLDSVHQQTYANIEHWIIDGASTDDTLLIAQRYQQDSRHDVKIQSEPDKGLYDAMNKGLQKATGDYIVFLNAGDTLYAPDTIATVVHVALTHNPSAIKHQPLPSFTAIRRLLTARATSYTCANTVHPRHSRGARLNRVCWCVTRHSMPVWTLPVQFPTISSIATLPMSTGASA